MITVLFNDCNDFSQDVYEHEVALLQLHMVECSCGKTGCLIRYGHYIRSVKILSVLIPLSIQRVRCKECGVSHALLPSLVVPYSQITLHEQQEILNSIENGQSPQPVMERNLLIDENNVKHIIRQFRLHWQQRLLSMALTLSDLLTIPCLHIFSRQFMQIRCTRNLLCSIANTA